MLFFLFYCPTLQKIFYIMNNSNTPLVNTIKASIEVSIRLLFFFLLVAWCLMILYPFLTPIVWGVIFAVVFSPIYVSLSRFLGDRTKLSSSIIVIVSLSIIVVPSYFFIASMVDGIMEIKDEITTGAISIPPPDATIKDWPIIGGKIYQIWDLGSKNLEKLVTTYQTQLATVGKFIVNVIMSVGGGVLIFAIAMIIAGVLLTIKGTEQVTRKLFRKLVGERGDEFTDISVKTIQNVIKGIIGVAVIQSILLGIIFLAANIPHAGLWALLCLLLSVIQIGPVIVIIPVVIYLYANTTPGVATIWTIILILASLSDNILKPILLGKGAPVPMLVIFLGSIGGFIMSGFVGLFTGAIVLSLGYKLFLAWINE